MEHRNAGKSRGGFSPGIEHLTTQGFLEHGIHRIGLISHLAAVDRWGCTTAQRLHDNTPGVSLACLMGPEHGFFGTVTAGGHCRSRQHPDWHIPIHSLYGNTRKPRREWLKGLNALVLDLQDLGCRPYTYVSTLRLVIESASEAGLPVYVADRPIPLPLTVDGPMLDLRFESFVGSIPVPMVYGMTPGETALWIKRHLIPDAEVKIVPMHHYHRNLSQIDGAPPFLRPSPSIVSRESALCFPATVCLEGLPHIDHGRQTAMPFQLVAASWTRAEPFADALNGCRLPGIYFHPHHYQIPGQNRLLSGVRLTVTHAGLFKPALTGITILHTLAKLYGKDRVWNHHYIRKDFFDKLHGTDTVRLALMDNCDPVIIANGWKTDHRQFKKQRKACLLYGTTP